jgi:hypothetical protein
MIQQFTSTHKKYSGIMDYVMAKLSELKDKKQLENELEFTIPELRLLLTLVAESTFKGDDVQIVYETAVKLQRNILKLEPDS